MKEKKFKVALIGYGRMGKNHARVVMEDARFELVAVIDPVRPNRLPNESILFFSSLGDFMSASIQVDLFLIAASTQMHFALIEQLLSLKTPIFVEKPLAPSSLLCAELIEKIEKVGTPVFVGHVERFNPVVQKIREVLAQGWLGEPIHFSITRVGGYPSEVTKASNVLFDLAVHDLDVLEYLVGNFEVVASVCHSTVNSQALDTAEILLKNGQGVSASVHVNWITPTKIRTLRITGTRGVCFADYMLQTCTLMGGLFLKQNSPDQFNYDQLIDAYRNSDRLELGMEKTEPLKAQLNHLAKFLNGEAHSLCGILEAASAVILAERAIQKSNGGKRVFEAPPVLV